jgi:hypothetical protein
MVSPAPCILSATEAAAAELDLSRGSGRHSPKCGLYRSPLRLTGLRSALAFLKRTIRAVRIAANDKRIPQPFRWLAALGLAPIPGPFDEALLLIAAVPLALFYRGPLAEAWNRANIAKPS